MEYFISGSSSSSSSSSRPIHVYLSFKGDNETCSFTDRLWAALESNDLNTFWDGKKLEPSDTIFLPHHFLKAIRQSNISIVVFSKTYASSVWCLEELFEIASRIHKPRYTVFPIFYGVDPSEVQNQSNVSKIAFAEHEQRFVAHLHKVQSWRLAMKRVANLSGWDVPSEELILPDSCITSIWDIEEKVSAPSHWRREKIFNCLTNMNICGSKDLTKMPNFKGFPQLEKLDLEGCTKLSQLDPSVADLLELKFLNLRNCTNLDSIPNKLFSLPSLEILNLACCSKLADCLDFSSLVDVGERDYSGIISSEETKAM
ncbi:disease resistance protein L6-like [Prosopis cineraria]|uniref:disease resistance protein L6-like n=1 Tax=Prosopis cineraria TaxID=364024 RepID=UPI00240ECBA8|nr:disease resistance protein L6-like [Prosopis cineraria]